MTGEWNGAGRTEIGIFRKGSWMLDYSGNGAWEGQGVDRQYAFITYQTGDIPVTETGTEMELPK